MNKHLSISMLVVALASAGACKSRSDDGKPLAADNTRDRAVIPTADNAVASQADLDLTQKIRKAILDDTTLSSNAHNCKIVVQDGTVTLVGPVASDAERAKVEQLAVAAIGHPVTNQLEVTN